MRPHELLQQGTSLSGERGLGSVLLERVTTSDRLLRLGKTPNGLQRIGQDIVGGRVAVIRKLEQKAQRTQVIASCVPSGSSKIRRISSPLKNTLDCTAFPEETGEPSRSAHFSTSAYTFLNKLAK